MRRALAALAVDDEIGSRPRSRSARASRSCRKPVGLLRLLARRQRGGAAERDGAGDVLGAGPDPVLLPAAMDDGLDRLAVAHDQRADALGRADLVAGQGEQGAGEIAHADGQLAECLHRVGVERHARGPTALGDLPHRLNDADLVVHPHDRDHGGPLREGAVQGVHGPPGRSSPPAGTTSRPPRCADGVRRREDRLVLDRADHGAHRGPVVPRREARAPTIPRLSASVPPEVKITWFGSAPTACATSRRACSIPARAARPNRWALEGLPKPCSVRKGSIASRTSGRTGVVAA